MPLPHHPGSHVNSEITSMARPSPQQEVAAALHAMSEQAKASSLAIVADLSEGGNDEAHVAEHIRGMVAVTMGHLSADASATTRNNAEQWQDWALDVADGVTRTVPATI